MATTVSQPRATEKFTKSFGGSLKSVMGSKGRTYFILEHKTASKKFRVGQTTEYIGDYIELGRGNTFTVNYGEDCPTVSRPHAAIIRKGSGWVLRHLSNSNPTLVNGRVIKKNEDWNLKNGDEIQLSYEGPVAAFLTPVNNSVNTLGMTVRLKAMANEAIRPYKKALYSLSLLLLMTISGLVYYLAFREPELVRMVSEVTTQNKELMVKDSVLVGRTKNDSLRMVKEIEKLQRRLANRPPRVTPPASQNSIAAPTEISALYPGVYYIKSIKVVSEVPGLEDKTVDIGLSGTGFLLKDGRFVTARHVIEPWYYVKGKEGEENMYYLNIIASNGGRLTHYLEAYSSSGDRIQIKSTDFLKDRNSLRAKTLTSDDGDTYVITEAPLSGSDWAVAQTDRKGVLVHDISLSDNLTVPETLHVLGYPFGLGAGGVPSYSTCQVSRPGLDNGYIYVSAKAYNSGNSGGPAFVQKKDGFYVVGIVSAEMGSQGFIVPIRAIR